MTCQTFTLGLAALLLAACAARTAPPPATTPADTCSSVTSDDLPRATVEALERATSSLEYEDLWRSAHPGASTGTLNGEQVRAIIRAHSPEVQECYLAALSSSTESGGRVVVRFVIDERGGVPSVSLAASELHAPSLGCCVLKRVAQWTFPRPQDGSFVVVEYPFVVHLAR